jgi:hypothetical protein
MSDFKCLGPDAIPSSAEALIPKDVNYVIIPGNDSTVPWAVSCCEPNPVNVVGGCYLWCEIPERHITTLDGKKSSDIGTCMRTSGKPLNEFAIYSVHFAGGASQMGVKGFGIWALIIAAMGWHLL